MEGKILLPAWPGIFKDSTIPYAVSWPTSVRKERALEDQQLGWFLLHKLDGNAPADFLKGMKRLGEITGVYPSKDVEDQLGRIKKNKLRPRPWWESM